MITLLTCTGARPEQWEYCKDYVASQTYANDIRWIIVDDGEVASSLRGIPRRIGCEVIRPRPFWKAGENSQRRNMLAGLDTISRDEKVVIWEDDDWYAPQYLETLAPLLDRYDLVGEAPAHYYSIPLARYACLNNLRHACLRASAGTRTGVDSLKNCFEQLDVKFHDLHWWHSHRGSRHLFRSKLTIGLKGLPGRGGVCAQHEYMNGAPDNDGSMLRQWIGDDAERYRSHWKTKEPEMKDYVKVKAITAHMPIDAPQKHWTSVQPGEEYLTSEKNAKIVCDLLNRAERVAPKTTFNKPKPKPKAEPVKPDLDRAPDGDAEKAEESAETNYIQSRTKRKYKKKIIEAED